VLRSDGTEPEPEMASTATPNPRRDDADMDVDSEAVAAAAVAWLERTGEIGIPNRDAEVKDGKADTEW
jgi:hypothetical protein